ncbi:MAG: NAD(P)H-dependent oxidoreductase [Deltaproteobacteria bacterium]|jgi:flavodoxin|nr:NAD(P)H-dependent oxidoreductase [Deltaproteobacteria bacterium]
MKRNTARLCALAIAVGSAALFAAAATAAAQDAEPPAADAGSGILVAYFSQEGHTKALAEAIHAAVGGDIFEIKAETPYPTEHDQLTERGKEEQNAQLRPKLAANVPDMSKYATVILGYPIWWGDMPMPVYTFIESHNFNAKIVAPFCTHGGSGLSRSVTALENKLQGAQVLKGLAVPSRSADSSADDVAKWLRESGITVKASN